MRKYKHRVELLLYRLHTDRSRRDRLEALTDPAPPVIIQHMRVGIEKKLQALEQEGLSGAALETALKDRWLDFQGNDMDMERMEVCLTHKATVQARIKAGVAASNPAAYICTVADRCTTCDCFTRATVKQVSNFDHGVDVFTDQIVPELQITDEDMQ